MDVEKEESILKKEVKICMPYYKIAYSIAFVVILSAIQPVVYANEIGQAVERAVSLLAVVSVQILIWWKCRANARKYSAFII